MLEIIISQHTLLIPQAICVNNVPTKESGGNKIVEHHAKREGEIKDLNNIREHTGLKMYTDADLAKDITTRRSVTSDVHEYNEVAFA